MGWPSRLAGVKVHWRTVAMTKSSMGRERPLISLRSEIFPEVSMVTSRTTSPRVPSGRLLRSGRGRGKNFASAMVMLPEPSASAPEAASGCSDCGESRLGEVAVGAIFSGPA